MLFTILAYSLGVVIIYFILLFLYNRYIHPTKLKIDAQQDVESYGFSQTPQSISIAIPSNHATWIYNRQKKVDIHVLKNDTSQKNINQYNIENHIRRNNSGFSPYEVHPNLSPTIQLKPYPPPQYPVENKQNRLPNPNNKVHFNPFIKQTQDLDTPTQINILQSVAKRYEDLTPVTTQLDPDSIQEEIFLREYSIPWAELELKDIIGEGAYGKVYKGRWRGTPVAIKVLNSNDENIVDDFKEEVYLLSSLRHPNISLFLAACLTPPHLALVTELATRGSLWDIIHTYEIELPLKLKVHIALDIAYGMNYLHSRKPPLLHRDLKSANILIDSSYRAKITDFGLARVKAKTEKMTGNCGTYQWMAPEVLDNKKYTEKADIYSYGILAWELYERKVPYEGKTGVQAAVAVLKRGFRPTISSDCPKEYASIIRRCWSTDPLDRPCFAVIIQELEAFYQQLLESSSEESENESESEDHENL